MATDSKNDTAKSYYTQAAASPQPPPPPSYPAQNTDQIPRVATGGSFSASSPPPQVAHSTAYTATPQQPGSPYVQGAPYAQQPGSQYVQGSPYDQQPGSLPAQQTGALYSQQYAQQPGAPYAQPRGSPQVQQVGSPYPQQAYVSPGAPQQQYFPQQPAPSASGVPQMTLAQQQAQAGQQYHQQMMGQCALGNHSLATTYGACGIIAAILLFPIGLIFLFTDVHTKCTRCGMVVN